LFQSLGNHEFDNNVQGLSPFIENLTSPVIAANLILDKVPELERQTNLKKSITFDISGTKVGITGYLTPDTKFLARNNDVEYIDEIVALKEQVANFKNEGVKIIIALGHSGFLRDLQIAKAVDGVDLIIGAHSNTFLWNGTVPDTEESQGPYPTTVKQASGRTVLVVQAYAYTKYLGKLHLLFDSDGEIISAQGQPILLDKSIPQDPEILSIVDSYKEKQQQLTDSVVGETVNLLDGLSCQFGECNLGNLIADSIFYTYTEKYRGKYWTDVNVAIMQGGGIRASIDHATREISKGDLLAVLPFGGNIVKMKLSGNVLLQVLERSISTYRTSDAPGEFLHFSGLKVVYDTRKPIGQRVVNAKVRCASCKIPEYFDLDLKKKYTLLVPIFVAEGGDGYAMLTKIPIEKQGYDELYCTENYIRRRSPVFPEVDGRVVIITNQTPNKSSVLSPSLTFVLLSSSKLFSSVI
jgi:5'-nucleotidase